MIHHNAATLALNDAWNFVDEKTVQAVIHSTYPNLEREVKLGSMFLDFLSPSHYCIELKKSHSEKGKRYLTRPNHAIGQVLGYKSEYCHMSNLCYHDVTPVIMVYGASLGLWAADEITRMRRMTGVYLWVLISLASPQIMDCDTGKLINLESL